MDDCSLCSPGLRFRRFFAPPGVNFFAKVNKCAKWGRILFCRFAGAANHFLFFTSLTASPSNGMEVVVITVVVRSLCWIFSSISSPCARAVPSVHASASPVAAAILCNFKLCPSIPSRKFAFLASGKLFENLEFSPLETRHKFPKWFNADSSHLTLLSMGCCGYQCSTEFRNSN